MADGRDFGTLINERRLALGYSLGQLANRVRATASEVRAWERGQRVPDDDVVRMLATELALDPDELTATARVTRDDGADAIADAGHEEPTAVVTDEVADTAGVAGEEEGEDSQEPSPEEAAVAPGTDQEEVASEDDSPSEEIAAPEVDAPAATAAAGEAASAEEPFPDDGDAPVAAAGTDMSDGAAQLADLPTEAVPVVAAPAAVAVEQVAAVQAPSHPIPPPPAAPSQRRPLDPVSSFLRVLYDPERRYLFWVRTALMLVVFLVFFRVLAWAVPAFFDTLSEILDTIESTTTDTTLVPGG